MTKIIGDAEFSFMDILNFIKTNLLHLNGRMALPNLEESNLMAVANMTQMLPD